MDIQLVKSDYVILDYRAVKPLQGERKILSHENEKKLIKSLKENGRFIPEYVWLNPLDSQYYTLDGHSRIKVYLKHNITFANGYEIPFLLVQASDERDAAMKLQIIDSDYGKISKEGMQWFADKFQLDTNWLNSTTALEGFEDFNFVEQTRAFKASIQRDMIPPLTPHYEIDNGQQSVSQQTAEPRPIPQPTQQYLQSKEAADNENPEPIYEQPRQPYVYDPQLEPQQTQQVIQDAPKPKVTDDDYASINEIVKYDTKKAFNTVVSYILEREKLSRREDAISFMVKKFAEFYQ